MIEVTREHIIAACEWAETAQDMPAPLADCKMLYEQHTWHCGTSCCIWGAASIIAGNGPAAEGPSDEWMKLDILHTGAAALMRSDCATPDQVLAFLRGADLSGANLRGAEMYLGNRLVKIQ